MTIKTQADNENEVVLEVEGVRKTFSGITAVDNVSFRIHRGGLTGLVGPNGAGKSTAFNCITGVHDIDRGRITLFGDEIQNLRPHEIATRGLQRTFQIARELGEMTVFENMLIAPHNQRGESFWHALLRDGVYAEEKRLRRRAWETLEFFEIEHLAEDYANTLSGGQRKLLQLARVLMSDPEVVLLDEPLAGVNPTLGEKLLDRIRDLHENQGMTFLLVEHDMDVIMEHCDRVIVMHQGSVLTTGTPSKITSNEAVIEAYLGGAYA